MIFKKEFNLKTKGNLDLIDITEKIEKIVEDSKIKEGVVFVFCPASTVAITSIEYEPNLVLDFKEFLRKLIPFEKEYHHHKTWGEENAPSHILSSILKPNFSIPIENGKMILGTWQQIVFCDFDIKPRERKVVVKILGEN